MPDGLILNRYRPISEAGAGGFATVQLAWDTRIQRRVAIKCMKIEEGAAGASLSGTGDLLDRMPAYDASSIPGLEEARTAAMLQDPHIVGVLDFEVQGENAYLIMEYVDGMTLSKLLAEHNEEITLDIVAAVFDAVSHALEVAHENQVLHLDIKPDNVLINRQGQVKVTDFGLATLSSSAGFSQAGGGTIGYMPPEQMQLEPVDERCDEWALASLTYEMIAGENPFLAKDIPQALATIGDAELVLPSLCMPDLDEQADDVLFYALDPDRNERYDTVQDFDEELQPFLGNVAAGTKRLAAIVGHACEDVEDAGEPPARVPRFERIRPSSKHAFMRIWSVAGSGVLSFVALANIAWLGGIESLAFWGVLALVTVAAALVPHLGVLLAAAALVTAFASQGAPITAVVLGVSACAWWFFAGRRGMPQADTATSPALFGSFGCAQISPLLCGYLLDVKDAAATSLFAGLLSVLLAAFGSMSLGGWWAFDNWQHLGAGYEQTLLLVLQRPSTWVTVASWVAAAVVFAACCGRGSRVLAALGAVLGGAILLGALALGAWLTSGLTTWTPDFWSLVTTAISMALACALAASGVPERTPREERPEH